MPEENSLILHVHELLQYLNRQGAATFVTVAQHGLVGNMQAPVDITYLADTVLLLRYFEARGQVRRAISVIKKKAPPSGTNRPYASIGSGAAGFRSESRSRNFKECCAECPATPEPALRCCRRKVRELRWGFVPARARSRAERAGCVVSLIGGRTTFAGDFALLRRLGYLERA
jgi:hypothetical protein